MKHQSYYPRRLDSQVPWLENYANILPTYAATLGLTNAQRDGSIADALWAAYLLGLWLPGVRAFSPTGTDVVELALKGTGAVTVALPTYTAPTLPPGTLAQLPGALTRIFALVGTIKLTPGYTEDIGTALGIVGAEESAVHLHPKMNVKVLEGVDSQVAKLTFYKYEHEGVLIECRRGTGAFEILAIDTESPYTDERPLLVPGTPEKREYRMRFWDKGTANGDWTPTESVTVGA